MISLTCSSSPSRCFVLFVFSARSRCFVFFSARPVLDAERDAPGTMIHDIGQALWWSLVTVTTVGYGDIASVTTRGRVLAGLFMIGSIAFIGIVAATLSSWIIAQAGDEVAGA